MLYFGFNVRFIDFNFFYIVHWNFFVPIVLPVFSLLFSPIVDSVAFSVDESPF